LQWLGGTPLTKTPVDIDVAQKKAYELLNVFENHLRDRNWLECDRATIADIACFPTLPSLRMENRAGCLSECSCMD